MTTIIYNPVSKVTAGGLANKRPAQIYNLLGNITGIEYDSDSDNLPIAFDGDFVIAWIIS